MIDIDQEIQDAIINNITNMYRDSIRISRRYYNNPPFRGYQLDDEQEYILSEDNDDISSIIFLDIATRFGSPGSDSCLLETKQIRKNKIKHIGRYKRIKKTDKELLELTCPICIDLFKEGEYYRNLDCSHVFHKRCIDRWFIKDHSECPMCRKTIIN